MRQLEEYANKLGIQKADIVSIIKSEDGTFLMIYYAE